MASFPGWDSEMYIRGKMELSSNMHSLFSIPVDMIFFKLLQDPAALTSLTGWTVPLNCETNPSPFPLLLLSILSQQQKKK